MTREISPIEERSRTEQVGQREKQKSKFRAITSAEKLKMIWEKNLSCLYQRLADMYTGTREGELFLQNTELKFSHNMIDIYNVYHDKL